MALKLSLVYIATCKSQIMKDLDNAIMRYLLVIGLQLVCMISMNAQTVVRWTGGGNDGLWSNKKNWSDDSVPDQTKYAIVEGEGDVHVDIDANPYQLQVQDKATLIIDKPYSLTIDGGVLSNIEFVGIRSSASLIVEGSLIINNVIGNGIRVYDTAVLNTEGSDEVRLQDVTGDGLRNDGTAILGNTSLYFISQAAVFNTGSLTFRKELLVQDLVFNLAWGINNYGEVFNNANSTINIRGQLGGLTSIINQVGATFHNHGIINIDDSQTIAVHNLGTFYNYNDISIDDIYNHAIVNAGVWHNETSSSIMINDITAPVSSAIKNSGGLFNNDGDIILKDIQYIGLLNEGIFNNDELLSIDSTRITYAIRNHGTINNNKTIRANRINYTNGSSTTAILNEGTGVINNSKSIYITFVNGHGLNNEGIIHSTDLNSFISMNYVLGDLFINEQGAIFEVGEIYFSRIF